MTEQFVRVRPLLAMPMLAIAALALTSCASGNTGNAGEETTEGAAESGFNLVIADCEDPEAAQAPIEGTFTLGYSLPLSGPAAGVVEHSASGYAARIAQANANNEVPGIEIVIELKDDGFSPDKAKANATEFLQKDKVDAISTFGAGQVGAMADDQNAACVPLLYSNSGDVQFSDIEIYPWTVQYHPTTAVETRFSSEYIKQNVDSPKVGLVSNPSASGQAMAKAFLEAADKAGLEVVAEADDTDPIAAATTMKEAGANAILHAAVAGSCGVFDTAMDRIGYKPELVVKSSNCTATEEYIAAGDAANGVTVPVYIRNPNDPDQASSPEVVEYLKGAADTLAPMNALTVSAWVEADLLVNTLKQAAASPEGLTRESIIRAARDQEYVSPMLSEGVVWKAGADRPAGVSGFVPSQWDSQLQRFVPAGAVVLVD